jgi:hypothetical protein
MTTQTHHDPAIDLLCETNRQLLVGNAPVQLGLLFAIGVLLRGGVPSLLDVGQMIPDGRFAATQWALANVVEFEPAGAQVIDLRDRRPCGVCGHGRTVDGCPCSCHWGRRQAMAGAGR